MAEPDSSADRVRLALKGVVESLAAGSRGFDVRSVPSAPHAPFREGASGII